MNCDDYDDDFEKSRYLDFSGEWKSWIQQIIKLSLLVVTMTMIAITITMMAITMTMMAIMMTMTSSSSLYLLVS
jgi:hypothetical protein